MTKKVRILLGLLVSVSFFATFVYWSSSQKITIINNSNKASPATVFAKAYYNEVKKIINKTVFYQSNNCENANEKFKKTRNAILVYNANVGLSGNYKGLNCDLPKVKPEQVLFIGKSHYYLCKNINNSNELFDKRSQTIGVASVALAPGLIQDFRDNGINFTGVPYAGSKTVLRALVRGDIDWGLIGIGIAQIGIDKKQIICPYSTDPTRKNYIGNILNLKVKGYGIMKVVITNIDDQSMLNLLYTVTNAPSITKFLDKKGFTIKKYGPLSEKDLEIFYRWIEKVNETYWNEK